MIIFIIAGLHFIFEPMMIYPKNPILSFLISIPLGLTLLISGLKQLVSIPWGSFQGDPSPTLLPAPGTQCKTDACFRTKI